MHLSNAMLSRLPPSLLVLLTVATQLRAQQQQHPTAIRKMSLDEGEMFLPEYYAFAPAQLQPRDEGEEAELLLAGNSSAAIPFRPPYPLHYDYHRAGTRGRVEGKENGDSGPSLYKRARDVLAKLQGRQFACPDNTNSCENIDQPNYCCTQGTKCFVVTNAPDAGNVGCCPDGQTCGVTVGQCSDGSSACPADQGGGCCISGFVCADVGCVHSTVSVITQTTIKSTTVAVTPSASTQVITVIVTVTPSDGGAPVLSTTTRTTTASATPTSTSSITATGGIPPYRPTSGSSSSTATVTSPSPSESTSYCPTGFYACLAREGGGCCRTGRDCSTTSCPAPPPMTTIISSGVTIAVPASDAQAAEGAQPTATCALGWFLCGEDAGPVAGCCPSGYTCGAASCTISTNTATATVQKELPNAALSSKSRGRIVDVLALAWVAGVSALVLI
ncbi:hypothetical protein F5Y00DRAFT_245097 [Daldinia vernicosa]|uniref:uncharacterized protein n=1 Tax=Daldinia vernicosa TaxID=114800 RepID=UPI002008DF3B|nr:uncharacterized protein F5Y00DRAFT_245097 [Daldinia vernicosa]KAI0846000.1 hypothetical protein F5Y00DRAFT_245097 [Daldinia vernicosa]